MNFFNAIAFIYGKSINFCVVTKKFFPSALQSLKGDQIYEPYELPLNEIALKYVHAK